MRQSVRVYPSTANPSLIYSNKNIKKSNPRWDSVYKVCFLRPWIRSKSYSFINLGNAFTNFLLFCTRTRTYTHTLVKGHTSCSIPTNSEKAQLSWMRMVSMSLVAPSWFCVRNSAICCWNTREGHGSVKTYKTNITGITEWNTRDGHGSVNAEG